MKIRGDLAVKQLELMVNKGYIDAIIKENGDEVFRLSEKGMEFLMEMLVSQYERQTGLEAFTDDDKMTQQFADFSLDVLSSNGDGLLTLLRFPEWYDDEEEGELA